MTRAYVAIPALIMSFGCMSYDGRDEQLGSSSQDVVTDCGDVPVCDCALKDWPICQDSDGDGVKALYDNCPDTYNPGQEDCDGDGHGDACDGDNAVEYQDPAFISHEHLLVHEFECFGVGLVPPSRPGVNVPVQRWLITNRINKWANLCGPSGSGTVSRGFVESSSVVTCKDYDPYDTCVVPLGDYTLLNPCWLYQLHEF